MDVKHRVYSIVFGFSFVFVLFFKTIDEDDYEKGRKGCPANSVRLYRPQPGASLGTGRGYLQNKKLEHSVTTETQSMSTTERGNRLRSLSVSEADSCLGRQCFCSIAVATSVLSC